MVICEKMQIILPYASRWYRFLSDTAFGLKWKAVSRIILFMSNTIKERFFFIGSRPKELRTTLSLTPNAHAALEFISNKSGDSIPEIICDALEAYLTHLAKNDAIAWPKKSEEEKAS